MARKNRFLAMMLAGALGGMALSGGAVQAERLNFSIGFPSANPAVDTARTYADIIEKGTNGEFTVRVYALELLSLAEMSGGIREGLTDIGYVLSPYFPSEFPNTNMAADLSMLLALSESVPGKEGMAYGGAMTEYVLLNCPDCNAEYTQQNQVFTTGLASSPYGLLCTSPVVSVQDLQGKRIRTGSSAWARWAQHFGASGVSLSGNEIYEALNQGVVDCAAISATELSGLGLMDAVRHITMTVPGGAFAGGSGASVNRNLWQRLSEEQRRTFLRAGAFMGAHTSFYYADHAIRNLETAAEKGIGIHEADPALVAGSREFIEADVQQIAAHYERQYGVQNAAEKIAIMRPLIEKWLELVRDVETADELAELYWTEVNSKVDVSKHGL